MKIDTEEKLAIFMAGLNAGKYGDIEHESSTVGRLWFGCFECDGMEITSTDFELMGVTYDGMDNHFKFLGFIEQAKIDAQREWKTLNENKRETIKGTALECKEALSKALEE